MLVQVLFACWRFHATINGIGIKANCAIWWKCSFGTVMYGSGVMIREIQWRKLDIWLLSIRRALGQVIFRMDISNPGIQRCSIYWNTVLQEWRWRHITLNRVTRLDIVNTLDSRPLHHILNTMNYIRTHFWIKSSWHKYGIMITWQQSWFRPPVKK